jgi:hypothetical protein
VASDANSLISELLRFWKSSPLRSGTKDDLPFYLPAVPAAVRTSEGTDLGAELGHQLVSEVLQGVRAGRQGVFVSDPERLRTAIFLRGYTLGQFARFAGMAPSTLSRALAGQSVAPSSWRALITALVRAST